MPSNHFVLLKEVVYVGVFCFDPWPVPVFGRGLKSDWSTGALRVHPGDVKTGTLVQTKPSKIHAYSFAKGLETVMLFNWLVFF